MRCSRGRGLLVRETSFDKQVAASSWEYEDWQETKQWGQVISSDSHLHAFILTTEEEMAFQICWLVKGLLHHYLRQMKKIEILKYTLTPTETCS